MNLLALVSGSASSDSDLQNVSGLTHETLKGISDVVNHFDARLIIDFVNPGCLSQMELKEKCAAFDGIIFIHRFEEAQVRAVSLKKPCVSADYTYPSAKADVVSGGDIDQFDPASGKIGTYPDRLSGFSRRISSARSAWLSRLPRGIDGGGT